MSFIEGFSIGLGMIIFIGPVFFLLLNSTLQFGVKAGVAVAFGIIFSDFVCVGLCYYGFSSLLNIEQHQFWIGIIGSVILFGMGITYVFKEVAIPEHNILNAKGFQTFFLKGFNINFFNPFVFAVWIGVYQYGKSKYLNQELFIIFLMAVLLGILTTDVLKVLLSKKVKGFISPKRLTIFFKGTGIILMLFAIRLLYLVW